MAMPTLFSVIIVQIGLQLELQRDCFAFYYLELLTNWQNLYLLTELLCSSLNALKIIILQHTLEDHVILNILYNISTDSQLPVYWE